MVKQHDVHETILSLEVIKNNFAHTDNRCFVVSSGSTIFLVINVKINHYEFLCYRINIVHEKTSCVQVLHNSLSINSHCSMNFLEMEPS
jgi:hypothetical protein